MFTKFVRVYVPSTRNGGDPLPIRERNVLIHQVESKLSARFGGCTTTQAHGCWVSDQKGLIRESIALVTSFYDDNETNPTEALQFAEGIARDIVHCYAQEAVTVETNEGIEFVS